MYKFEFRIKLSLESIDKVQAFSNDAGLDIDLVNEGEFTIIRGGFDHHLDYEYQCAPDMLDESNFFDFVVNLTEHDYTFKSVYIDGEDFGGTALKFIDGEPVWSILNEVYGL